MASLKLDDAASSATPTISLRVGAMIKDSRGNTGSVDGGTASGNAETDRRCSMLTGGSAGFGDGDGDGDGTGIGALTCRRGRQKFRIDIDNSEA